MLDMRLLIKKYRKQIFVIFLSLVITSSFMGYSSGDLSWPFMKQFEDSLYDLRVVLTASGEIDERVVIIDIDEKSLAEVGRYPWSRDKFSDLVDQLFDYYFVGLIGFDIYFREADESSGIRVLEQLAREEFADIPEYQSRLNLLSQRLDFDQRFVDSMMKGPVVLGYTFFTEEEVSSDIRGGVLPPAVLTSADFQGKNVHAPPASGYGVNLPILQAGAVASGHTSRGLDEDVIARRVPMLMEFDGNYYESLSLAIARYMLVVDQIEPVYTMTEDPALSEIEALRLGEHLIPVDVNLQALIPFRGPRYSFKYISAVDVMERRIPIEDLQSKIVLVGTSAKGLSDLRQTPIDDELPGVEIHANLISGIFDQAIKQRPVELWWLEYVQLLFLGIFLSLLFPKLSPIAAIGVTAIVLLASSMLNFYFWQYLNIVVPLASILSLVLTLFLVNIIYGFTIEWRGKRQLSNLFGQYLPPELVDEMSEDPESYIKGAQNREMSVLFSDIRGFTTISESLSASDLSELMNLYLTPMTAIIHTTRGTIDKYIGDAVMAFWGAPLNDPDHARHAIKGGLDMLERLKGVQEIFQERGWPEIKIGVGINSGLMSVGDMGSEFRMAYTVLGDAVNIASRLEGLTKNYGVEIIVGQATKESVDEYVFLELDLVRVKGKEQPVAIYEPIALFDEISVEEENEIALFHKCLQHFRQQDWETAETILKQLIQEYPERLLYTIYTDRIAAYRLDPPGEDWDGVFTHKTK
ncbi:MAG: CHASE2 domain-containing protein [Gammaproteobacteria bacterium]|jgi:adenylate cyclase